MTSDLAPVPHSLYLSVRIVSSSAFASVIREQQDVKTDTAPQPTLADTLPDLPAGLLGLEIPPEVRNALKVSIQFIGNDLSRRDCSLKHSN